MRIFKALAAMIGYGGDIDAHPPREIPIYSRDGWEIWLYLESGFYGYRIAYLGVQKARSQAVYSFDDARFAAIRKLVEEKRHAQ
jgi:hypothetical protein